MILDHDICNIKQINKEEDNNKKSQRVWRRSHIQSASVYENKQGQILTELS